MNIFALDDNPKLAARYACDQHVVKMPLETAQLLCTARHMQNLYAPYFPFNPKHPCCQWAHASLGNYVWLLRHGIALSKEYTYRYKRIHKSFLVIEWCKIFLKEMQFAQRSRTPFVQCMPKEFQHSTNPIEAYRQFYRQKKVVFARWRYRPKPVWFQ